jgi:hypothetical protein
MALLDDELGIDPRHRDWVRMVDSAFRSEPETYAAYLDHYAEEMGVEPAVVTSLATPPLGIHAVGLMATDDGWQPALLVMQALAPASQLAKPAPAETFPSMFEALARVGNIDPTQFLIVGIDPPEEQYEVVRGDLTGTLGLPVRLSDGSRGALTAGHVTQRVGSLVTLGSGIEAPVVFRDYRARYISGEPCADVASIRLDDDWRTHVNVPRDLVIGDPEDLRTLRPLNRSGTGREGRIVRCIGEKFFVREYEGSWGDFILVDPISVEGDSGSLALTSGGRVAGQVVGGRPGAYSIVQDIRYLMWAAQVEPDLAPDD